MKTMERDREKKTLYKILTTSYVNFKKKSC